MLKQLLTASVALSVLLVGSLPVRAQEPGTPAETQMPETPQEEAETSQGEISPAELQKFANVIKQMQKIDQQSQTEMIQAIESQGLSPERFGEIFQARQAPEGEPTAQAEVSEEELQQFEQANARLSEVQQEFQSKVEQAVQAEGLELPRFEQIAAAVQQDPALQQQVQQMIQN